MRNKKLTLLCLLIAVTSCFLFATFITEYTNYNTSTTSDEVLTLYTVTATIDGASQNITLPYKFTDLDARTEVIITAQFPYPDGGYFYIETAHTPLTIVANNETIYSYGEDGTFPTIWLDPVTTGQVVSLETFDETIEFTMIYQASVISDSFTIEPVIFGTQEAIYETLFSEMGFSIIFGGMLIIASIFMICIVLPIMTFEKRSIAFLWLALALLTSGLWLLCDSPLTSVLISNPVLLYILALYGMISFPIPLIYFGLSTVKFHNQKPLLGIVIIYNLCAACSILLQLIGLISAYKVKYFFNFAVPLCVSLFALLLLIEYIWYQNKMAKRFSLPALILAAFTILEILNTNRAFANLTISLFQIGILVFLLSTGIIGGYFVRDALALRSNSQKMELDLKMMEYQAKTLKSQSSLILETTDTLKKQRHDLRHQLTVIRDLATQETTDQLLTYLDTITTNIPSDQIFYCNNVTINAILSHYASICERNKIEYQVEISIPSYSTDTLDADYCIIFGNLLENAIEACQYVEKDPCIKLSSRVRYNTLIITMVNSFDGNYTIQQGKFRSRKRSEYGIGLTSIQTTAEKYGGDAQFKGEGTAFHSSIYMTIDD